MNKLDDMQWRILCAACGRNSWYFNVANLHYEWGNGSQTTNSRRLWYKPLISLCQLGYTQWFVDHYTESPEDPNLMDISYIEVEKIDFRRRMHFRATRKGWNVYRKLIKEGRELPQKTTEQAGYWIVEDETTGHTWKEDAQGIPVKARGQPGIRIR